MMHTTKLFLKFFATWAYIFGLFIMAAYCSSFLFVAVVAGLMFATLRLRAMAQSPRRGGIPAASTAAALYRHAYPQWRTGRETEHFRTESMLEEIHRRYVPDRHDDLWLLEIPINRHRKYEISWISGIAEPSRVEQNKQNVIGWSAAPTHALEAMDSAGLQVLVDSINPYSGGLIEELLAQLDGLEDLPGKHKQAEQLHARIHALRMLPVELETKRQQLVVDALLERADHAVQSVRELSEG